MAKPGATPGGNSMSRSAATTAARSIAATRCCLPRRRGCRQRTAAEIGYALAKGKPIVGYRGDFRLSADNEGSIVNLQVEYFIRQSGGDIIAALADAGGALEKIGKP